MPFYCFFLALRPHAQIIFKSGRRLSSFFPFKDKIPKSLMSGVIYQYTCAKCNLSYVGCTKRFWETRLQEHTHVSGLTGKPLNGMQIFAPMQHARAGCHVRVSRDDFKIIGHEKDPYLLLLKESIVITTSRAQLNGNIASVPLHLFSQWMTEILNISVSYYVRKLYFCIMFVYILFDGHSMRPKRKEKTKWQISWLIFSR